MSMQVQTQPVVAQEVVLSGLDNLSRHLSAVIKLESIPEGLEAKLREVDREVSALYCAVRFGQPGERRSDSVVV